MDFAQIDEVQGRPGRRFAQQADLVGRGAVLLGAQPQPDDRRTVGGDHVVDQRSALDQALAPQPDRLWHRHDQPVAGESAHERVGMLAQQGFGAPRDLLPVSCQ